AAVGRPNGRPKSPLGTALSLSQHVASLRLSAARLGLQTCIWLRRRRTSTPVGRRPSADQCIVLGHAAAKADDSAAVRPSAVARPDAATCRATTSPPDRCPS